MDFQLNDKKTVDWANVCLNLFENKLKSPKGINCFMKIKFINVSNNTEISNIDSLFSCMRPYGNIIASNCSIKKCDFSKGVNGELNLDRVYYS